MNADVIVVGAGPAGLSAAEVTARAGLHTVVLDRLDAIGTPVRTSGGSWVSSLQELGIAPAYYHPIHRIRVASPRGDLCYDYDQPQACVLHVRELYQHLADRAVAAGAVLRLGCSVQGPLCKDGAVVGVTCVDAQHGEHALYAKLVIDASGYASRLARATGQQPGFAAFGLGAEQELLAPNFDEREAWLLVGEEVAPAGYGWAFPDGRGRVRLGLGLPRPPSDIHPRDFLDRLPAAFPALEAGLVGASPIENHLGLVPFAAPRHVKLAAAGLLVAGDAAAQVSALVGEGIRYAIHAGRMAGDTAAAAVHRRDVSASALRSYERAWYGRFEREMKIAYASHKQMLRYTDAEWAALFTGLRKMAPTEFAQGLKGDFSLGWALRMAWRHPPFLLWAARAGVGF